MRLGVVPEGVIDRAALASGQVPIPLLEGFWGLAVGNMLVTAVRLGVFESLAAGRKTAAEVSRDTATNAAALETLLNGLNGFGYLRRHRRYYSLTRKAAKWLTAPSPKSMRDSFLMMHEVARRLANLETVVRTGATEDFHRNGQPAEFWRFYLRSLAPFARLVAPEIVRKTPIDRAPTRLLDVGGGHGVYSIAFCRRYPDLQAEIIDLPDAASEGAKIVAEHGFAPRVRFRHGDLRVVEWGHAFDVVLLFNIIHNVSKDQCPLVLTRAHQALRPGGTLVILDSEHTGDENDLTTTSGFGELVLFLLNGTRPYPQTDIVRWLSEAGFSDQRSKKLLRMPMTLFLCARK